MWDQVRRMGGEETNGTRLLSKYSSEDREHLYAISEWSPHYESANESIAFEFPEHTLNSRLQSLGVSEIDSVERTRVCNLLSRTLQNSHLCKLEDGGGAYREGRIQNINRTKSQEMITTMIRE